MENKPPEDPAVIGTLMALILDLYSRQIALTELLPKMNVSPEDYREALDRAGLKIDRHPGLKDIRNRPDAQSLAIAERALRTMPK